MKLVNVILIISMQIAKAKHFSELKFHSIDHQWVPEGFKTRLFRASSKRLKRDAGTNQKVLLVILPLPTSLAKQVGNLGWVSKYLKKYLIIHWP